MGGVLCVMGGGAGGGVALSYSGTVTVGTASIGGKGFVEIQHGYANAAHSISGSIIGSRSPTTTSGFTIVACYWIYDSTSANQQSFLVLTGDAHAYTANLVVNGLNQNLGLGTYDGTNTTYASGTAQGNPWGADASVATVTLT